MGSRKADPSPWKLLTWRCDDKIGVNFEWILSSGHWVCAWLSHEAVYQNWHFLVNRFVGDGSKPSAQSHLHHQHSLVHSNMCWPWNRHSKCTQQRSQWTHPRKEPSSLPPAKKYLWFQCSGLRFALANIRMIVRKCFTQTLHAQGLGYRT